MSVFLLMSAALLLSTQSFASESCSSQVQKAVEDRIAQDFPSETLVVDNPDTSMVDGGSEYFIDVNVRRANDKIAYVTYSVLVGETCQVLSVELKR